MPADQGDPYDRLHALYREREAAERNARQEEDDLRARYAAAEPLAYRTLEQISRRAVKELLLSQVPLVPLSYVVTRFGGASLRSSPSSAGCWPLGPTAEPIDRHGPDGVGAPGGIVATAKGLHVLHGRFYPSGNTLEHSLWAKGGYRSYKTIKIPVPHDTYLTYDSPPQFHQMYIAPADDPARHFHLRFSLEGEITYNSPPDLDGDFAWSEDFETVIARSVVNFIHRT